MFATAFGQTEINNNWINFNDGYEKYGIWRIMIKYECMRKQTDENFK